MLLIEAGKGGLCGGAVSRNWSAIGFSVHSFHPSAACADSVYRLARYRNLRAQRSARRGEMNVIDAID
ncbi:hypothetical protein CW304_32915 [Bacillus sp. UFRGS-B20]|nr:hypothetical protein CW304_32915 [Bacillus sp. UFRGS-B20]